MKFQVGKIYHCPKNGTDAGPYLFRVTQIKYDRILIDPISYPNSEHFEDFLIDSRIYNLSKEVTEELAMDLL